MNSAEIRDACLAILARNTKPTRPEVQPIVDAYYALPDNGAGGSLHILLEDGNVTDDNVRFCLRWAEKTLDEPGTYLALVLLRMSRTQRYKLGAGADRPPVKPIETGAVRFGPLHKVADPTVRNP